MTQTATNLTIDRSATVNEILVQHPATVSVFNSFGIDACCGGDADLVEAARRDGADVDALLAALERVARDARKSR
jgi:iron-sulfur cluster repair protein YtfE (RIC family)